MKLYEIIWKERFVDKIDVKHHVLPSEVEEVIFTNPHIRKASKGHVSGEDLYVAYGQTTGGRYLVVFFVHKYGTAALPISARDMTQTERRYYERQE